MTLLRSNPRSDTQFVACDRSASVDAMSGSTYADVTLQIAGGVDFVIKGGLYLGIFQKSYRKISSRRRYFSHKVRFEFSPRLMNVCISRGHHREGVTRVRMLISYLLLGLSFEHRSARVKTPRLSARATANIQCCARHHKPQPSQPRVLSRASGMGYR